MFRVPFSETLIDNMGSYLYYGEDSETASDIDGCVERTDLDESVGESPRQRERASSISERTAANLT